MPNMPNSELPGPITRVTISESVAHPPAGSLPRPSGRGTTPQTGHQPEHHTLRNIAIGTGLAVGVAGIGTEIAIDPLGLRHGGNDPEPILTPGVLPSQSNAVKTADGTAYNVTFAPSPSSSASPEDMPSTPPSIEPSASPIIVPPTESPPPPPTETPVPTLNEGLLQPDWSLDTAHNAALFMSSEGLDIQGKSIYSVLDMWRTNNSQDYIPLNTLNKSRSDNQGWIFAGAYLGTDFLNSQGEIVPLDQAMDEDIAVMTWGFYNKDGKPFIEDVQIGRKPSDKWSYVTVEPNNQFGSNPTLGDNETAQDTVRKLQANIGKIEGFILTGYKVMFNDFQNSRNKYAQAFFYEIFDRAQGKKSIFTVSFDKTSTQLSSSDRGKLATVSDIRLQGKQNN